MKATTLLMMIVASVVVFEGTCSGETEEKKRHHHHKHHRNHASKKGAVSTTAMPKPSSLPAIAAVHLSAHVGSTADIVDQVRRVQSEMAAKETAASSPKQQGKLKVNGPLPTDFSERFVKAAAKAANCSEAEIKVMETRALDTNGDVAELTFEAPADIVISIEDQSADPQSALAIGSLRPFLVADGSAAANDVAPQPASAVVVGNAEATEDSGEESTAVQQKGIDVDTQMPYGELEPFGRENTAQELTESSIKESNEMVDQLERAEVAEEKRAVFRALTRLRGAAITSFDGVARSQTGNIDEYNKVHKWRNTHPLVHLADEESDVSKWAFPDEADFF